MGDKEKVRRWIDEMPEEADVERVSAEILRRHRGEGPGRITKVGVRSSGHPPKRHPVADILPLLVVPLFFAAIFLFMPIMFRLGDAILGEKPRTPVARGEILELRAEDETGNVYGGDKAEVHYDWVMIEQGEEAVILPRERIRLMRVRKE